MTRVRSQRHKKSVLIHVLMTDEYQEYMDGPKSNENDFFAQRSRARKG